MSLRVGSLFAGIGGFDLAAEAMGWSTAWVSEIDPFASAVLERQFPDAPNLGDVTAIRWEDVPRVDVVCGGFPCQPHSLVGERKASSDERDLWSECVRTLRVLRPRYAVFENVPGLLTSDGGRFFNAVLCDVAASGYAAEWSVFSAKDVGSPHERERLWIVCWREWEPIVWADDLSICSCCGEEPWCELHEAHYGDCECVGPTQDGWEHRTELWGDVAYPERSRLEGHARDGTSDEEQRWELSEPARPVVASDLRIGSGASGWTVEPTVGRVAYGVPDFVARIKALGNAIVPLCAVRGPFARIAELEASRERPL